MSEKGAGDAARRDRLKAAAARALAEAEERRRTAASQEPAPAEVGGRGGPEPTRYGDWEKDGVISDF